MTYDVPIKSISSKFNSFVILVVAVTALLITTVITFIIIYQFTKNTENLDFIHLKGTQSNVESLLDQAYGLNHQLSINPQIINAVSGASSNWKNRVNNYNKLYKTQAPPSHETGPNILTSTQSEYKFVELFFLQDINGDQVARSFGPIGHRSKRWWYKEFLKHKKPFISKSYFSLTGNRPVSSVFHPVFDKNKKLIGILGTDINFDKLQSYIEEYIKTKGLYVIVVDNTGVVIAHPNSNAVRNRYDLQHLTRSQIVSDQLGRPLQDSSGHHQTKDVKIKWGKIISSIVNKALNGKTGIIKNISIDDKLSNIYYSPIRLKGPASKGNYAVLLIRNISQSFLTHFLIGLFLIACLIPLSILFITIFKRKLNHLVIEPLNILFRAMDLQDARNHSELDLQTNDEFELIANKYNEMQKELIITNEKLSQTSKMEAIGLMAGGVAHDLNNILSGVVTYPDFLLSTLPEGSELREPLLTIRNSGKRASEVVLDLLTLARGVAKTKSIENLNSIVDEFISSLEYKNIETKYHRILFSIEKSRDLENIYCSAIHMEKCIMNLLINAAESIHETGHVVLSTYNYVINNEMAKKYSIDAGRYAALTVNDTGHGISPENIERIYEPFYTKRIMGRKGTGLGLSIVWNAVEEHCGLITVDSSPKGSSFNLYFPATQEKVKINQGTTNPQDIKGEGQTILIIDDDKQQRKIAGQILTSLNYKVYTESSGERACEFLNNTPVDLLLLDMIMDPGMNGRETFEKILKINPTQKAIIVSGYAKNEEVEKTLSFGANKFVKKPYILDELGLSVKEVLQNQQFRASNQLHTR